MKPSPNEEAERLMDAGMILDQCDIPTRYPDAIGFPGLPYETYPEQQAKEAVELASRLVAHVRSQRR